jgi:putative SOS response-associated peptidase YedK
MCNRYENRGSASVIRRLAERLARDLSTTPATDNLAPIDDIYPDQDAPIVRNLKAGRLELTMARWGLPPIPGQTAPITNIRNLQSRWWRQTNRDLLTDPVYRCLVPFTAFAEPVRNPTWFVVPGVEVATFAGVWQHWRGLRLAEQPGKKRREKEERDWLLFAFLTTEANDVVRPVHDRASPVILFDPTEQAEWLNGGEQSLRLQRPLPNERLVVRSDRSL